MDVYIFKVLKSEFETTTLFYFIKLIVHLKLKTEPLLMVDAEIKQLLDKVYRNLWLRWWNKYKKFRYTQRREVVKSRLFLRYRFILFENYRFFRPCGFKFRFRLTYYIFGHFYSVKKRKTYIFLIIFMAMKIYIVLTMTCVYKFMFIYLKPVKRFCIIFLWRPMLW